MRTLLIGGASVLLAACVNHVNGPEQQPVLPETGFTVIEDQRFTPSDWPQPLSADIYQPVGDGRKPAVLVVHGGGWERRSPDDMARICKELASHGFVAVNIAYRFAPQYQFPAQLHDLQQAMHWIHANAERYDIDTARVSAMGYSAGAHLVSLMALVAGQGGELDSPYGGPQTRPVAVIAGGTPSDLRKFEGGTLVPQFLGGTISEIPGTFAKASPVTHVHDKAPPFFIYHGSRDMLVSADHATDFHTALQREGVYSELFMLRLRGHVAAFLTGGSAVEAGMHFLRRHMAAGEAVLTTAD